jgi:CheY-like chemotaxis protein
MKKCLVVDDVEVTRFTTRNIAGELGVEMTMAESVEQAKEALNRTQFDVILLDWHLRKESGLDLLKHIRGELNLKVPVILFSGVEGSNKSQEAMQAGANAFLEKPTTKDKLQKCLQDLRII